MKNRIDELLKQNKKSRYWLANQLGMTYPNLVNLCKNQTGSIRIANLEKICDLLDCTPNDVFDYTKNREAIVSLEDVPSAPEG